MTRKLMCSKYSSTLEKFLRNSINIIHHDRKTPLKESQILKTTFHTYFSSSDTMNCFQERFNMKTQLYYGCCKRSHGESLLFLIYSNKNLTYQ